MTIDRTTFDDRTTALLWVVLLATSSVLFSFAWACATPFAALATIAGTRLSRRDAFASVTLAWLGNQAIGYLVLHYPRTPDSFGWGMMIGIAAIAAAFVASAAVHRVRRTSIVWTLVAFAGAFATYETVLLATTSVLQSGYGTFAGAIILRICEINAVALVGLLILARVARAIGLPLPARSPLVTT